MSLIVKIVTLMKYRKLKLILVFSHCFILTPVLLIRTLKTLNIYSKPLIIAVTESRILRNQKIKNINLQNYVIESTRTESQAGGTLLYINDQLAYKARTDKDIYQFCELESTFIVKENP